MTDVLLEGSKSEIIEAVLASLKQHPDQWVADNYVTTHKSGVYVWTANSYYGLSIGVTEGYTRKSVVGGVTGWSSFFGGLIPWRRRVYDAARPARAPRNSVTSATVVNMLVSD